MKVSKHLRCERKFLISNLSTLEVEELILLHPALFSPIYHERFVNNIYFDNLEFLSYFENQDGITPRKKVRIRWYGELNGQIKEPILEIKKKSGIVGKKETHALPAVAFKKFFSWDNYLNPLYNSIANKSFKNELILLEPTLINRYCRKYFLSADGHYRITLDSNINFFPVRPFPPMIMPNELPETYCILELKYNHIKDSNAPRITNHFPFRLTKSSKYVLGINKLHALS
jgi:hypothetical protein